MSTHARRYCRGCISGNMVVECKHYQQGVPPDKIQGALAWATAERPDKLLIIASNFLSNPNKDHLESFIRNNKPSFRIKYWEKPDLEKRRCHRESCVKRKVSQRSF